MEKREYPAPPLEKLAPSLSGWLDEFAITHCGTPFLEMLTPDQMAIQDRLRTNLTSGIKRRTADAVAVARRELRRASRSTRKDE